MMSAVLFWWVVRDHGRCGGVVEVVFGSGDPGMLMSFIWRVTSVGFALF
jgi:hypothetical protein